MTRDLRAAVAGRERALAWGVAYVAVTLVTYTAAARPAGHRVGLYLAVHGALAALCLASWALLRRRPPSAQVDRGVAALVACGVLARLVLVPCASFTTTDVGRYLWDGAVTLRGYDPYALPPEAPVLAAVRAVFPMPADHHAIATCYPPLAVALFALAAATGPARAFVAWKLLVALASSTTVLVVWRHLRGSARAADVVLLALGPLAVLEDGVGGHLDAFVALSVAVALVRAEQGRWHGAALAAGCAGALKLMPGLLVLPLALRAPRRVLFAALSTLPLSVSVGAALGLGLTPPGSLPVVAEHWSFAAPLWTALYRHFPTDDDVIRPGLAGLGLAGVLVFCLGRAAVARKARGAYGVLLATSPVLYPWYGGALVPLGALAPAAWALALVTALPCSYEVLDAYQAVGRWTPARWPLAVIAGALGAGVLLDLGLALARRWRRRAGAMEGW